MGVLAPVGFRFKADEALDDDNAMVRLDLFDDQWWWVDNYGLEMLVVVKERFTEVVL